jgi:hypothetical protein
MVAFLRNVTVLAGAAPLLFNDEIKFYTAC